MKILALLRHAKSDWSGAAATDFDRSLNDRGRGAARAMGAYMASEALTFDRVLASPAVRVKETLDAVARSHGRVIAATFDARMYMAPASLLIELVRDTDEDVQRLLLVGHNPGLGELALALGGADGPFRRDVEAGYPTGTLAEIMFESSSWNGLEAGRMTRFVRLRDLTGA